MSSDIQRNDRTYVPRETAVALRPNCKRIVTPTYDLYELQAVLDYYAYCGITSLAPAWDGLLRIAQIAQGNGIHVREQAHVLLEDYGQMLDPVSSA